jgi:hypothetical protein
MFDVEHVVLKQQSNDLASGMYVRAWWQERMDLGLRFHAISLGVNAISFRSVYKVREQGN